jgi:hypothetical protein
VSGGTRAVSGEQKKSTLSNYSNKLSKFRIENRKIRGTSFLSKNGGPISVGIGIASTENHYIYTVLK